LKRKRVLPVACLLLSALLGIPGVAYSEHLPVKIYTSADGLGSGFIDFLMRDSRGFIWICTRDGLSRFDGSQFITYQIGDETAPGVESFYETRDGVYWIGTTGGLYRFNPDSLAAPKVSRNGRPILTAEFVNRWRGTMLEDRKGNLWFLSDGVFLLEEKNGKASFTKLDLNLPTEMNQEYAVTAMYEAEDGSFWISTSFGLVRRLPDARTIFYPHPRAMIEGSTAMLLDTQNRVWLKRELDLFVIKPEPIESLSNFESLTKRTLTPTTIAPLKTDVVLRMPEKPGEVLQIFCNDYFYRWALKGMYATSDGHVWITTEQDLFEYDGQMLHRFNSSQGLATNMVRMAEDAANNLWFSGQTGLVRLDRKGLISYGEMDGLSSPRLNSIYEDRNGSLYISNGNFFLSKLENKAFQTVELTVSQSAKSMWTSRSAFLDSHGEWWVMTTEGLYRFAATTDFASLDKSRPVAIYTERNGLKSNNVYQVFEDKRGDIWVSTRGTSAESGLYRWSRTKNTFYELTEKENFPSRKAASSFAEDNHGNLWFGFYEGGLARYKDGRFTILEESEGGDSGVIIDLLVDRKGALWFSSSRSGLHRIDDLNAENLQYASYTTNDGLTSNNVRTITEDAFGNLYLGTVRGVDRFTPETGRVKHFSVSDGLASDFVVDSHCDKSGTLWFATVNGLSKLVPSQSEPPSDPQIWLGGLRISGLAQAVSQLGSARIPALELHYTENNFQIDFFGLDFRAGETLRYQYKLEGSYGDWSAPSEQRSVTFANLSPARYRFLVRAVNSDGVSSSNPAVIEFTILPPIWLRWWFLAIAVFAGALTIYAFWRYRYQRMKAVFEAQEALRRSHEERFAEMERIRKRIATDLHDDIGSSLTQISILSEVVQQRTNGNNSQLSEPLSMIAGASRELVDAMSDIVWAINPQKDHLNDLTQRMRRFASDVLTARNIAFEFIEPDEDNDIVLGANIRREVFLIFKESINNLVRHSSCTEARIDFQIAEDTLNLIVCDDGRGFDVSNDSEGHGLSSMRQRASGIGGRLEMISQVGKGTTIKLELSINHRA
jgi:signal transduction histidine kinase/streptogramin lyase